MGQQHPQALALQRAGLHDGGRQRQLGVGAAEALEVKDGVGPKTIELGTDLAFHAPQQAGLGADKANFLAYEHLDASGQKGYFLPGCFI
jgi:hypothetical protein